ncbi:MAG: hypothetical protein IKO56_08140 [Alphaproteobacteria bacterium]|nr:hypothetical protein [Alphaproteobacteria bacterium]
MTILDLMGQKKPLSKQLYLTSIYTNKAHTQICALSKYYKKEIKKKIMTKEINTTTNETKKDLTLTEEQKEKMKHIIEDWFDDKIKPNCFVSIQFTKHLRRTKLDLSYKKLYEPLYQFHRDMYGRHLNRHIIPGLIFAEQGHATTFHFHIYFYNNDISIDTFKRFFEKVSEELRLPPAVIDVRHIKTVDVYSYGAKELFVDANGNFDPYRIIDTELLFALYKRKSNKAPVPIKIIHEQHYALKDIPKTNWKKLNELCGYRKKIPVNQSDTINYRRKRIRIYIPD